MKKMLESGKIWTVLSALLFFLTCGVFVAYAASGSNGNFYNTYNTGAINNTLTASGWNLLMEDLDNLIPEGAVMAFMLEECPDGWDPLTEAEDRFLMGTNDGNKVGDWSGSNEIKLEANQLPPHQHYLRYGGSKVYDNPKTNYRSVVTDRDTGKYPRSPENPSNPGFGSETAESYSYYDVSSAPYGSGWRNGNNNKSINIQNPYLKVRYCIKGSHSTPNATIHLSCNSAYNCTIPQSATAAPLGSNITLTNYGDVIVANIGDKTLRAFMQRSTCFNFKNLTNNCGDKLTNNCSITANFEKKNNFSFQHNDTEGCISHGDCGAICRQRAVDDNVCGGGNDYSIGGCSYNTSNHYCTCSLY